MGRILILLLFGILLLFFSGCASKQEVTPEVIAEEIVEEPRYFIHTIEFPGENLWIIANWYTGDGELWQKIKHVNEGIDPQRLQLGDMISIPEELITNSEVLTRQAVITALREMEKRTARASLAAPVEKERVEPEQSDPLKLAPQPEDIKAAEAPTVEKEDEIRARLWAELAQEG